MDRSDLGPLVRGIDGWNAAQEFGVGDFSFGGDQNAREVDGKKGHRSGVVGEAPAVLMLVQFDDLPPPSPCDF